MLKKSAPYLISLAAGSALRLYFHSLEPRTTREYHSNSYKTREESLNLMKSSIYDILVIGGGATGAGVVLDAASRGLKCALIEAGDFSGQTSSKSTKLIHGGVRYLEKAVKGEHVKDNLILVSEALKERSLMIKSAPNLTGWVPLIVPVDSYFDLLYIYAGVWVYQLIAVMQNYLTGLGSETSPRPYMTFSPKKYIPNIQDKFKGAVIYYDGQMNDSRHCITALLTAATDEYIEGMTGAHIANYCSFIRFEKIQGKIVGAWVKDELKNEEFLIRCSVAVNCTGPYADSIRKACLPSIPNRMVAASGSHFLLPGDYAPNDVGLLIPKTQDGRVLFLIPWRGHTLVGTTDYESEPKFHNSITDHEKAFLIDELARYINKSKEEMAKDLTATFCGQRPLVKSGSGATADLSRRHEIEFLTPGLVSVMGGKWTIFRAMGEDAVTEIIERFGLPARYTSRTQDLKLVGCVDNVHEEVSKLIEEFKVEPRIAEHLVREYGSNSRKVLSIDPELNTPINSSYAYLKSEILYAIRYEYARKPDDILARRLRLAFQDIRLANDALPIVLEIMSKELAWDESKITEEQTRAISSLSQYT